MNSSDYLDHIKMKTLCDTAKQKLFSDNEKYAAVISVMQEFVDDDSLEGEAYTQSKLLLLDFIQLFTCLILLNEEEMDTFLTFKSFIPDRDYYGTDIFERRANAQYWHQFYSNLADNCLSAYNNCPDNIPCLKISFYSDYCIASELRSIYERKIQITYEEENEFDTLNLNTAGMFDSFSSIRTSLRNALEQIRGAIDGGAYIFDPNASWRTGINQYLASRCILTTSDSPNEEDVSYLEILIEVYPALLSEFGTTMLTYDYFSSLSYEQQDDFVTRVSEIILPAIPKSKIKVNSGDFVITIGPGLSYYVNAACAGAAGDGSPTITATINQATETLSSISISEAGNTFGFRTNGTLETGSADTVVGLSPSGIVDVKRIVVMNDGNTYFERAGIDYLHNRTFYEHTIQSTINSNGLESQVSVTAGLRQTIPQQDLAPEPVFAFEYEYSQMIQNTQDNPSSPAIGPNIITIEDTLRAAALCGGLAAATHIPDAAIEIGEFFSEIGESIRERSVAPVSTVLPVIPNPEPFIDAMERVRQDTIMYNEDGEIISPNDQMETI